ncbi:MAG: hypothetical protein NVS1B10_02370 [Candidatus Saccharimonadales bacterium]
MIQSVQKIVQIGSSDGVTIPAKELKRANIKRGDEVEVIIRPIKQVSGQQDQTVLKAAKKILKDYQNDFQNLANR